MKPPLRCARATLATVITQIIVIDLVFSLDSIITAVGMVDEIGVMVAAVVASVALMMAFSLASEVLNIRRRKRRAKPVNLHDRYEPDKREACPTCGAPTTP